MGISVSSTGAPGAARELSNLQNVSINVDPFPVPRLELNVDGTLANPAIRFASEPNSGIALTAPKTVSIIADGVDCFSVTQLDAAVNHLAIIPSILGSGPTITVSGTDIDSDLRLLPRGTGTMHILKSTRITDNPLAEGDPDASAVLELLTATKGFLKPRMTTAERDAIASPATGLEVFDTDLGSPMFFAGAEWRAVSDKTLVILDASAGTLGGAADPVLEVLGAQSAVMKFESGSIKFMFYTIILPQKYVDGTNLLFRFYWSTDSSGSGDVRWQGLATAVTPGESVVGTSKQANVNSAAPGVVDELVKSPAGSAGGSAMLAGDLVHIRIQRTGNHAQDTFGSDARLSAVTIEAA